MLKSSRHVWFAMLLATGLPLAACTGHDAHTAHGEHPSEVEHIAGTSPENKAETPVGETAYQALHFSPESFGLGDDGDAEPDQLRVERLHRQEKRIDRGVGTEIDGSPTRRLQDCCGRHGGKRVGIAGRGSANGHQGVVGR